MSTLRPMMRRALKTASAFTVLGLVADFSLGRQQEPPPPAAPRSVRIPKPIEKTLSNALRVIVIPKRDLPLVTVELTIKTGAEADPADQSGLADLSADLLTKGTTHRSAPEVARAIESLGGELSSHASWDSSQVTVGIMASKITPALEILADVVRNPTFGKDEIERLRQQALDDLKVALQEPSSIARFVAARAIYGDGAYGHPRSGTPQSLVRIQQADVIRFHSQYYRPDNAMLIFCGDIESEAAFELAEKVFGNWPKPSAPIPGPVAEHADPKLKSRVVVVDMPEAGQAAVLVARPAIKRADPAYFPALTANSVLGGGYSARLNQEIRIKRGLSYGAGSMLEARRNVGPFMASVQTKNESAAEVVSLVVKELERLAAELVPEAELAPRKSVLTGNFGRSLETTEGLLGQVAALALHDASLDEINTYIDKVQSVTAEGVRKCAQNHLGAEGVSVIVVGNSKAFLPGLRKQFPKVEVVPLSGLDLNSSRLRQINRAGARGGAGGRSFSSAPVPGSN
jgi:zinc protease